MLCCACFSKEGSAQKRHRQVNRAWNRASLSGVNRKPHVLFLGLNGGGKSSLLFALTNPPPSPYLPISEPKSASKEPADEFSNAVCLEGGISTAHYEDSSGIDGIGRFKASSLTNSIFQGNIAPAPTLKTSSQQLRVSGVDIIAIDTPGARSFRETWPESLPFADVIVFVIDASDVLRLPVARHELWQLAKQIVELEVSVLVLANKQDLVNTPGVEVMSAQMIYNELHLNKLEKQMNNNSTCSVRTCTARDPTTIEDALECAINKAVARCDKKWS